MSKLHQLSYFLVLCCCFSVLVKAEDGIIYEKELRDASFSRTWLKLGLYEEDDSVQSGYVSAIHSTSFFLSEKGSIEPLSELIATIVGFQRKLSEFDDVNEHPICRFPARAKWLALKLPKTFDIGKLRYCKKYLAWAHEDTTDSISIVFATGYLGNPASFYGHTLLKFNSSVARKKTVLADVSVNYGAIIPDNENPVVYIAKGLFGGYAAAFSHIEYYFHDHNYGENELRDMWEYELALDKEESQLVIAHSWEVLGKKYTYHFLRQNCAYRMAELLEIIDGIDIKPKNPVYLVPQALIQKLSKAKYRSKNLVAKINFHPSRQSRFYEHYSRLSHEQQLILNEMIVKKADTKLPKFASLSSDERATITDVELDYYQYVIKKDKSKNSEMRKRYDHTLAKRFLLPTSNIRAMDSKVDSPDIGRNPSMSSFEWLENSINGHQVRFKIRPAYYDSLDSGAGHIDHSTLSMAELGLRTDFDKLYLDYFDLFNVRSINSRTTGLPEDSSFAWNFRTGSERINLRSNATVFRIQGDVGKSFKIGKRLIFASYIGGGLQDKKEGYGNSFLRISLESHLDLSQEIRVKLSTEHREYYDRNSNSENIYSIESRYRLSRNKDIRLNYKNDGVNQIGLSFGFYW